MGVNIDDTDLTWRGSGGMEGRVNNGFGGDKGGGKGIERRDGDWDCPACGKMVFASKDECFACGEPKPRGGGGGGGGRYDDSGRGGRSPPRRSPPRRSSRDDYGDRGGRRGRDYDESPPRRRRY